MNEVSVEDHVLLSGTELRVALDDLVDGVHQVFLSDRLSSGADCEHASLGADRADVCACRVRAHSRNQLESNVLIESHSFGVNFKDLHSSLKIGQAKFDLSIETTGSGQGRIEGVWSVGCHEHLHIAARIETIKLVHNFKHSSLYLAVSVSESSTTDGVDLIEEDNARFL